MKVFSKRYSTRDFYRLRNMYGGTLSVTRPTRPHRPEFLESSLRVRLNQEINYLISSGEYIEPFMLSKLVDEKYFVLYENAIQRLSYHELGYDITEYYSCDDLIPIRISAEGGNTYYDKYLLDLVEIIIIFSLEDRREETVRRFQKIFTEENANLLIYGHMIVIVDAGGLQSITSLLSDNTLKEKLDDILVKRVETTIAARESADITQRVFSSATRGKTKQATELIIDQIADRWIDQKEKEEFKKLMNSLVKDIKGINNQIANIRHTDRSTITFGSPDIFKLIRNLNLAISEMAILTTQDEFIEKESVTDLKRNYLEDYNIKNVINEVPKENNSEPVNLDDIPF